VQASYKLTVMLYLINQLFQMEQRKLIRLGNSSFAIALPKNWVVKAGLKKGDNIFITPNSNGELIVQPSRGGINGERKIEINIEEKDGLTLRREIVSCYINGYNLFHIKGKKSREISDGIKKAIDGLVGMEIIKNESEEIIAKDLFNMEEMDISNFVRRIDNNLREMFDILIEGFNKRKITQIQLSDIIGADADINKFHLLISRILSIGVDNPSVLTGLKIESLSLVNNWWFSFNLEHIGDEIKSVIKTIKNETLDENEYEKFIRLLVKLREVYNNSLEFFYSKEFSKEKALEYTGVGKKVWNEFDKLTLNKKSVIARLAMRLKDIENSIFQNIKMVLNNRS